MAFRFQKRIKIAPGVRLNLSKSGISTSVGKPGATVNIGKKGVKSTVGLPGSGLSYSHTLRSSKRDDLPHKRLSWVKAAMAAAIGVGCAAALIYLAK